MTRLDIGLDPRLPELLQRQVADIVEDEILELGVQLERESPQGVSPTGQSLSSSYDIQPAAITADGLRASLFNTLPFSFERLAGRGPGRQPPISKLERWARSKGLNPYAVARKIGREGTERFKQGESGNILQANPRTKVIPTNKGPQQQATDRMVARINDLRF